MADAIPRPASTVVVLRDVAAPGSGVEVWLMRRRASMAFAGGMHAFPGGAVDAADHDPALPWSGPSPESVATVLGTDPPTARALVSAAVRETFEECGLLLASGARAGLTYEPQRLALLDGTLPWPELLRADGLTLDASALLPWSRWITPAWSARRFDAYFFVAGLPAGGMPRWIDGEADRAGWSVVRAAVAAHDAGTVPMLPPTVETLRSLAGCSDVAAALAAGPARIEVAAG